MAQCFKFTRFACPVSSVLCRWLSALQTIHGRFRVSLLHPKHFELRKLSPTKTLCQLSRPAHPAYSDQRPTPPDHRLLGSSGLSAVPGCWAVGLFGGWMVGWSGLPDCKQQFPPSGTEVYYYLACFAFCRFYLPLNKFPLYSFPALCVYLFSISLLVESFACLRTNWDWLMLGHTQVTNPTQGHI